MNCCLAASAVVPLHRHSSHRIRWNFPVNESIPLLCKKQKLSQMVLFINLPKKVKLLVLHLRKLLFQNLTFICCIWIKTILPCVRSQWQLPFNESSWPFGWVAFIATTCKSRAIIKNCSMLEKRLQLALCSVGRQLWSPGSHFVVIVYLKINWTAVWKTSTLQSLPHPLNFFNSSSQQCPAVSYM